MIKKNIVLVVGACMVIATAQAMNSELPSTITLPSAQKLSRYLFEDGFGDFVTKNNIDRVLGDQTFHPQKLLKLVNYYVIQYAHDVIDETKLQRQHAGVYLPIPEPITKEQILKCILRNSPELCSKLLTFENEIKCTIKPKQVSGEVLNDAMTVLEGSGNGLWVVHGQAKL